MRTSSSILFGALFFAACGGSTVDSTKTIADAGNPPDANGGEDASPGTDAAPPIDAASRVPVNHRTSDSACQTTPPAGSCSNANGPPGMCGSDSDCTMGTNGRCQYSGGGVLYCACEYDSCAGDGACGSGQTCACHGDPDVAHGNTCVPGDCRTDGDCGTNGYCSPSLSSTGCGGMLAGYYCHTKDDACIDDSDCGDLLPAACSYDTNAGRWSCISTPLCG